MALPADGYELRLARMDKDSGTEDGDSIFLRNVGIYLRIYTAPKPRTITSDNKMAVF
jgi:hypothetical protein